MSYQALIFDLDGTLLDSLPDLTTSVNLLRTELELPPVQADAVRAALGEGARYLLQSLLPANTFSEERLEWFLRIYREHLTDQTRLYAGAGELLKKLAGQPMALVTNKPTIMACEILKRLNLTPYFRVIYGGDSFPEKKPHPRPLQEALRQLDVAPQQALMIGDHHTDLQAGKAAGVPTCFCAWGYGNDAGEIPDIRVASIDELARILGAAP